MLHYAMDICHGLAIKRNIDRHLARTSRSLEGTLEAS